MSVPALKLSEVPAARYNFARILRERNISLPPRFVETLQANITNGKGPATIFGFDFDALMQRRIRFDSHCFGCTAGAPAVAERLLKASGLPAPARRPHRPRATPVPLRRYPVR